MIDLAKLKKGDKIVVEFTFDSTYGLNHVLAHLPGSSGFCIPDNAITEIIPTIDVGSHFVTENGHLYTVLAVHGKEVWGWSETSEMTLTYSTDYVRSHLTNQNS